MKSITTQYMQNYCIDDDNEEVITADNIDSELDNIEDEYLSEKKDIFHRDNFIIITGCSGGGKSTLLSGLSRKGYLVVPEPGRQIVKEQESIGGYGLPWENLDHFLELALSRYIFQYNSQKEKQKHVFSKSPENHKKGFTSIFEPNPVSSARVHRGAWWGGVEGGGGGAAAGGGVFDFFFSRKERLALRVKLILIMVAGGVPTVVPVRPGGGGRLLGRKRRSGACVVARSYSYPRCP